MTCALRTKPQHKVSWKHPPSKRWHQLDLILVRRAAIKNVLHTRSYHSAGCDTDHSLACCKIRMQPRKFHRTKAKRNPRIDVSRMSQPDLIEQLAQAFEKECGALQPVTQPHRSGKLCVILCTGQLWLPLGRGPQNHMTGSRPNQYVMTPVIEAKRAALAEYKREPSEVNQQILRNAGSKAQQTARRCTNKY